MQKEANAGKRRERKAFVAFLTLYTSQKAVANEVTIKINLKIRFATTSICDRGYLHRLSQTKCNTPHVHKVT